MTTDVAVNGSTWRPKLTPGDRRQLCRALAAGEVTRAQLARRYGVSRAYITQFARMYAAEIDQIKARLEDEFAGLWVADKAARIAAHQADYEMALDSPRADHHEWIKTRTQVLHAVAEELGQLPPRTQVNVAAVTHIIEGVDLSALT